MYFLLVLLTFSLFLKFLIIDINYGKCLFKNSNLRLSSIRKNVIFHVLRAVFFLLLMFTTILTELFIKYSSMVFFDLCAETTIFLAPSVV